MYNLWCFVSLNCFKIIFFGDLRCFVENFSVAIYALLCGEKIEPKNVSVEKNGQISCVALATTQKYKISL